MSMVEVNKKTINIANVFLGICDLNIIKWKNGFIISVVCTTLMKKKAERVVHGRLLSSIPYHVVGATYVYIIKTPPPPYQGKAFCFCTVSSAGCGGGGAATHGRLLSSIPCHPDIYKTSSSIHLVFNVLDTSINS